VALLDPLELREDCVANGSRLNSNHCRDGKGKDPISRSHGFPSDSKSNPPPGSDNWEQQCLNKLSNVIKFVLDPPKFA
jgi:hypothetical protein